MKRVTLSGLVLAALLLVALPAGARGPDPDAIVGVWNTQDNDARIELFRCGAAYCGRIEYLAESTYPSDDKLGMGGLPMVDRFNPDPSLRRRPLVGMTFLEGFRYAGDNSWEGGRIYNPENGKFYKAKISLGDTNHVLLRGYWGISLLGRTETWVRVVNDHNPGA